MTLCNETTAQGDRPLGAVDGNISRSVGDYMPRKRDGVFRLMSLNIGNFTAKDTDSNKLRDLFSFIARLIVVVVVESNNFTWEGHFLQRLNGHKLLSTTHCTNDDTLYETVSLACPVHPCS